MQENEPVEKKRNNTSAPRGGPPKITRHCFSFEERLRAVKLHLEEGFTQETVAEELGISSAAVYKWTARYRLQGRRPSGSCQWASISVDLPSRVPVAPAVNGSESGEIASEPTGEKSSPFTHALNLCTYVEL